MRGARMRTFSNSATRTTYESLGRHGIIEDSRDLRQAFRSAEMTRRRGLAFSQLAKAIPSLQQQPEGRDRFVKSWSDLLTCIESKRNALRPG